MKTRHFFTVLAVLSLLLTGCGKASAINSDPDLNVWVQENIVPSLTDPRIEWNGEIVIKDLGMLAASSQPKIYYDILGKPNRAVIRDVILDDSFDVEQKRLAVKKEVFANYVFLNWWLDNSGYVHVFDSEFVTLMDGMGYNVLAPDLSDYYSYLVFWDGVSIPTCDHLKAINTLYQEGLVAGNGVERLLRQKCQGSS